MFMPEMWTPFNVHVQNTKPLSPETCKDQRKPGQKQRALGEEPVNYWKPHICIKTFITTHSGGSSDEMCSMGVTLLPGPSTLWRRPPSGSIFCLSNSNKHPQPPDESKWKHIKQTVKKCWLTDRQENSIRATRSAKQRLHINRKTHCPFRLIFGVIYWKLGWNESKSSLQWLQWGTAFNMWVKHC